MFEKLIREILKREKAKGKVNLKLVSDQEIRRLNREFRSKDKTTDVLAFPFNEEGVLGDIAISRESARRNAKKFGVSFKEELKRLVIHGVLHLLDYKHGKRMKNAEEVYQKF